MFVHEGEEGTINAQTTGASYMRITPVLFETVSSLPDPGDTSAFTPTVRVETLLADGDNDLELSKGIRLYNLEGSQTVSIPLPGTLEYVAGVVKGLTGNATINADALERYLDGYIIAEDVYVYSLPNGTMLYVDAQTGEIVRLSEYVGAVEVITSLSDYEFIANDSGKITEVVLGEGVSLNLENGLLSLEEGASYETLLEVIVSSWIMNNIGKGNGQFIFTYEVPVGVDNNGNQLVETVESTLTDWKVKVSPSGGTVTYYWLTENRITSDGLAGEQAFYLIVNDTSDNTLSVYVVGGDGYVEEQAGSAQDEYNYYTDGDRKPCSCRRGYCRTLEW